MTADVPVGASCRGVWTSAVVALMQAAQPNTKVRTFTVAMPDIVLDESAAAGAVAHHLGTEHTTVELTAGEAMATITELPRGSGRTVRRPVADPVARRTAREHMTVAVTGDGGDEVRGYNRYVLGSAARLRLRQPPGPVRRGLRRTSLTVSPVVSTP